MQKSALSFLLYHTNLHNDLNSQLLCWWFSRPLLRFLSLPASREQSFPPAGGWECCLQAFQLGSWENWTGMAISRLLPFLTGGDFWCLQIPFPSHTSSQLPSLPWGQGAPSPATKTEIPISQPSLTSFLPPALPHAWDQGCPWRGWWSHTIDLRGHLTTPVTTEALPSTASPCQRRCSDAN